MILFVAKRDNLIQRNTSEDKTHKNNNLKQASATTT